MKHCKSILWFLIFIIGIIVSVIGLVGIIPYDSLTELGKNNTNIFASKVRVVNGMFFLCGLITSIISMRKL